MKAPLPEKVKIFSSGKALFLGGNFWDLFAKSAHQQKANCKAPGFTQTSKMQSIFDKIAFFRRYTKLLLNQLN